jgi:ribosomal protein L16 Arg81 hydroxylase
MPVAVKANSIDLDALVDRMLGDNATFFQQYWRKRPFFAPAAGLDCIDAYGINNFLADMVRTQHSPFVAVKAKNGERVFSKHHTAEALRNKVRGGAVSSMKISKTWHHTMPDSWLWMRGLFVSLCRAVAMFYMNPARSEDVDVFLAGPQSSLGAHFDMTDVFTLQLFGERRWIIDEEVQLENVRSQVRDPNWSSDHELNFQSSTREFVLRPGDALYVPAYAVHRVMGVNWSVSLSLGLRTFNEIDIVEHLLERIHLARYMELGPVASLPDTLGDEHAEAKLEVVRRVRALLAQIEGATVAAMLKPLTLPSSFDN